jgi:hypothetical protein
MQAPLKLHAPWDEVRELLKEVNTSLTDDDLDYDPEREDELLERLQLKMNKSKDQLRAWIESVSSNTGMAG